MVIANVLYEDAGEYTCTADNGKSADTRTVVVVIAGKTHTAGIYYLSSGCDHSVNNIPLTIIGYKSMTTCSVLCLVYSVAVV